VGEGRRRGEKFPPFLRTIIPFFRFRFIFVS
jgi:hypothetical protein